MAEGGREGNMKVGDGGVSNTVAIRGFSKKTSQELMEMYFENSRRSGGGDLEEVKIRDDVAYITFKEAEVARRVASRSSHQVDGHTLTVTLFRPLPPKPCYQNRVLLQGLNNAITEEMLRNFLETETKAQVTEFLYGEQDGNIVVTFSDNIDIVQLGKIVQECSIAGVFIQVERVEISNCILVQNLQPSSSPDVMLYYFENKKRSGGGDVERVEMKTEERYCLIYFEDPSVIDRVLGKSHIVDGVVFEINIHHECLGRRSSRQKSDLYLRISSPGNKDNATLEEEDTDNGAKDTNSSSITSNPEKDSDFVEVHKWQENDDRAAFENTDNQVKETTSSSVSSNPEKESDFVEVQGWQENDGKNCTLPLCIKYKRTPDKKIIRCIKNIPCSWNFHLYWKFYTKTEPGKQMLHEILNKYNCSVAVFVEDEDLFLFEISVKIFEQESDMVQLIHDVFDNVHKCAQQVLYLDNILVDQRIQGDVLQEVRQRKELDIARFELMGQQDVDALYVACTEKDQPFVLRVVTEILHMVKECFENHEETIHVEYKWQKVMKTFGYLHKLCVKYPSVTISNKTEAAIILKGPRDQSKPAADYFMELLGTASSEVQEDIFSPGCQFEIFTYQELCSYIDHITMEYSIVWIPNHQTRKMHIFSKKTERKMGLDKLISGCVKERLYPLAKDQTDCSTKIIRSLEELKKMHTGKMVFSSSDKGLLLTATDDIFESIDDAVQEVICQKTENIKANLVLPTDKSVRPLTFSCPRWNEGQFKDEHILSSVFHHLFEFISSVDGEALLEIRDTKIGSWDVRKFIKWMLLAYKDNIQNKLRTTVTRLFLLIQDEKVWDIVKGVVIDVYSFNQQLLKEPQMSRSRKAIRIIVVKDQITKRKEDVLVNSAHHTLNLSHGRVSTSILEAAGEDIQKECNAKYPDGINPGQVAVTKAYKLRDSKFVFHGTFDVWKSQQSQTEMLTNTLQEFVTKCLQKADENHMKSIAFPALGTGNLAYPPKIVADCMFEAVENYSQTRPIHIDIVTFVVYYKDISIVTAFHDRMKQHDIITKGSSDNQTPPSSSQGARPKQT